MNPKLWVKFGKETGMPLGVVRQHYEPTDRGFGWEQVVPIQEHTALLSAERERARAGAFEEAAKECKCGAFNK
jgi:hypothetical protein